ncbi:hypothetical protein PybrP1_004671 [[Pythium] brassicae (nom. inval.)]|nr:hypothetical protein PybrP1_004671 [[Pythium] brassicae (nom. inval.)]
MQHECGHTRRGVGEMSGGRGEEKHTYARENCAVRHSTPRTASSRREQRPSTPMAPPPPTSIMSTLPEAHACCATCMAPPDRHRCTARNTRLYNTGDRHTCASARAQLTHTTRSAAMATAVPIADVRYLWSEVDRLKSQVAELQSTERRVVEDQTRIRDYVVSFVTHAQLEAALCTKISQSSVVVTTDKLRAEMMEILSTKADEESVQTLQNRKLDISAYETAAWDLKKLRVSLEQNLLDMFASFAHQIEAQVSSKVSIEDFNHIFNPDANGQKEAIESAAARISRMKDQLESLQEYVNADRLRQHKVADLNVSVLDLTRKHNASRNAMAQLVSTSESVKERIDALETGEDEVIKHVKALTSNLQNFKEHTEIERAAQNEKQGKVATEVQDLQTVNQKMVRSLEQIQQFTRDTLVKSFDAKLKQITSEFHRNVDELGASQHQCAQAINSQFFKVNEKLEFEREQASLLDGRLRKFGAQLRAVKEDLDAVRGPLATLATNLREENVAILQEIQRSQVKRALHPFWHVEHHVLLTRQLHLLPKNESRDIILDYQELLEKEQQMPSSAVVPSRPSSVAARASSAYASRKHKQQVLSFGKPLPRPQTSSSVTPRTPKRSPNQCAQQTVGSNIASRVTASARAQTAGATPKTPSTKAQAAAASINNLPGIDTPAGAPDAIQRKSLFRSLGEGCGEAGDALFHFPSVPETRDFPEIAHEG